MDGLFAIVIGIFFAASLYLMMSRRIVRILIGVAILGNAVNLLIFTAGRLAREVPPVIAPDKWVPDGATANPLPQALILTAIVISFSFFAFLLVLAFRTYRELGTDAVDEMRLAEPAVEPAPPGGY
ncbi:Na+/H+ antiporter subunit C [Pseudoxanthobacter sp.]|uniref:Na+/H+ antiporter subunit C n=1 Tax=Pseudoxanthobacter sp. TaxID=1925742 RepID=UPI002FE21164